MEEYVDRMGLAYQAVTYGDLAPLYADLPAAGSMMAERKTNPPVTAPPTVVARRGILASLPTALKVLWTIWLAAVSINVVVWALVSGTTDHPVYPWPVWGAGPYGAALFAVSAGVTQIRRSRLSSARRLAVGEGLIQPSRHCSDLARRAGPGTAESDPVCSMRPAPRLGAAVSAALARRLPVGVRGSSELDRPVTGIHRLLGSDFVGFLGAEIGLG